MRIVLFLLFFTYLFCIEIPKEFSADFNQTIASNKKKLKYKGKFFYKQNEIVWKYTYPYKKIIWIKDKIYIYEPDLMQVTIMDKKDKTLDFLIKKAKKIKKNIYMTEYNGKKYYFVFDKTLKKVFYNDEMGNKVEIIFYNQKTDVNNAVFKIDYPEDVDVIYQK